MTKTNADILEGMISTAINSEYLEIPPTEFVFNEKVQKLRESLSNIYQVSDAEFAEIKRKLQANVVVQMDMGVLIKDSQKHRPWLSEQREALDFFFWKRYKTYLEEVKKWNPRLTGSLGRVSDEIIDCLGNPNSNKPFQRRGLVIGDVQSGKTANYTAICNKAADTGYRVIIILAGMMENLRRQTQERLDAEFSGRKSEYIFCESRSIPVGVGRYGQDKQVGMFTSVTRDFNKNILHTLGLSLQDINAPVLFVVKKNKSILNNLINWLKNNSCAYNQGIIDLPMLLIDDEADNASVNTKKDEEEPTAINDAIRRLLKLFKQTSYLGITATPYANIFINPDTETEMQGDDLFPRDFIYSLTPPTNYIGAESIFGEQPSFADALETICALEADKFFPFNHKKNLTVDELPPSLKEAIAYFLIINAIRDFRGDLNEHRSMMIHVSRFTNVQNQVSSLTHDWIENMQSDLRNYACLSEGDTEKIENIAFLKAVWQKHGLVEKIELEGNTMSWQKFLSDYLCKAISPVVVRTVNQHSGSGLDYHNYRDNGLRVIAVGGNSLSRGLTLEGLGVTYFYRRSQMYDTLLQMGRWFGYRVGYDDLFKIWISSEAIDWYGYITAASEELRREVVRMKEIDQTPMEFGLKVRQDPASLIVTARNKMRSATPVKRPVTVSGRLLETPRLKADLKSLESNKILFLDFVKQLPEIGRKVKRNGHELWEGVSKDEVEQLVREFKTHPWHLSFQGVALADFIRDSNNLLTWDVAIVEGVGSELPIACGEEIVKIKTGSRIIKATKEQISISGTKVRVGAGGVARIGLTQEERQEAENNFKKHNPGKSVPDSAYLKIKRNPILMLHIIFVDKVQTDNNGNLRSQIEEGVEVPDYLYALGIGIPEMGKEETACYVVNMIEFENYYDTAEDEDE